MAIAPTNVDENAARVEQQSNKLTEDNVVSKEGKGYQMNSEPRPCLERGGCDGEERKEVYLEGESGWGSFW